MLLRSLSVLTLLAAAWTPLSRPAGPDAAPPRAQTTEHPYAWLAGRWVGQGLGGEIEEVWSAPRGGVMLGMFQHLVDGRPNFYELFTIGEEQGEWVMRLRHFGSDLRAWEDRDGALVWKPTTAEPGSAGFGPVFYEKEGDDKLRVSVELDRGEGSVSEEFVLTRAR